jgi:cytochrome c biogenesis protein CcmG, thiol:disulfide interchange protein DsbE
VNDQADPPSAPSDADTAIAAPDPEPTQRSGRGPVAGIPTRTLVAATLIAAVVAFAVGLLVVLAADDNGPEVLGEGTPDVFQLVPDEDPEVLGAPAAVTFETFDGERANTGAYVGQPLVLNFFAEWCPPCVAEMPDFEAVHLELDGQVAFLGLSYLESSELGLEIIERTGITYDVGRDPDGDAFAFFGGLTMPTTVFIDSAGTVVDVYSGALTADQLRDRIATAFEVRAS